MEPRTVRLTIDSDLREVRKVRRALDELAAASPFSPEQWHQIEVCVIEAANNAVIHAYGGEKGHEVAIEVLLHPDRVVCRVANRGRPMKEEDLRRKAALDYSPEDIRTLPEGGMGLYIIHRVMDRVEYRSENGRNILTMTKFAGERSGGP